MHALICIRICCILCDIVWRQLEPCVFYAYSFGCTHFLLEGGNVMSTRPGYQLVSKYTKMCAFCKHFQTYDGSVSYRIPIGGAPIGSREVSKTLLGVCEATHRTRRRANSSICSTKNYIETRLI